MATTLVDAASPKYILSFFCSTSGTPPKRIGYGRKEGERPQGDSVRHLVEHLFEFRRVLVNCNCPTRIERHHRWPVEFEARLRLAASAFEGGREVWVWVVVRHAAENVRAEFYWMPKEMCRVVVVGPTVSGGHDVDQAPNDLAPPAHGRVNWQANLVSEPDGDEHMREVGHPLGVLALEKAISLLGL